MTLNEGLDGRKIRGHSSSPVNCPNTGDIQNPSPHLVSPQEKNHGTLVVEISSTKGSISCHRSIPYNGSILKERQLRDLLYRLEGALDGESNDTFQSKQIEMHKETSKVIPKEYKGVKCICYNCFKYLPLLHLVTLVY